MNAYPSPRPFSAATGYTIQAVGGTAPYEFVAAPSPPNPAGVQVDGSGNPATVTVPSNTPSGTMVYVQVTDSSTPPQSVMVQNMVA